MVSPSSEIITLVRMTRTTAKAETTKRKMVIGKNTNSSVRVTFSKLVRQTDLKREREKAGKDDKVPGLYGHSL